MQAITSSKRFIAFVVSIAAMLFKDRLPITQEQLELIATAIGTLIMGDSINPIGKLANALKDPRVIAALASIAVTLLKDKIPVAANEITLAVYLACSVILGYSVRPPEVKPIEPEVAK
jgi:hypothetical protein